MAFNLADVLKDVSDSDTGREQIEYIHLDLIDSDPNNFYQLSDVDELAANIELCGLQQPIRLRPNPENAERYIIISGHRLRAALQLLAKDDSEKWSEVPCIVSRDAVSPALQQLQLIFANSNTRKMTDPEIAEQAAQVKKLLYQLKEEEGYEFPGRMRDHVANIVGASKSKLARLEVISKDLSAPWQSVWKSGTLAENTAYELSRMPKAYQNLLFEEKHRTNANLKYLYTDDVKKFAERAAVIEKQSCNGEECANCENKLRKAAVSDRWGWFYCDSKCCKDCPELLRCQKACPKLKDLIQQKKASAKEAAKQEKLAQAEKGRPAIEKISALWQRFGLAREMAFKDFSDCKQAMGIYYFPYDDDKAMKLECGEAKINPNMKLPFGYSCYLPEIQRLIALADLFDCSLDWLLCRTDVREMATEAVSEQGTIWHPISEEPPVGVDLVWLDGHGYSDSGEYLGGQRIETVCTIQWGEARWWAHMPKEG